ncbi:hypothetical protein L210DRAFT_2263450 [Boletus edulis BED1]|uniref:Uncharacterized protein n=1 Tax=Boletus edulis BED1 TaxID=1328754 RepID=A0AAD4GDS7_BOLED|nr:hypothetical protein L210DRAFT_2263450 [Boletus edulis BED1]
MLTLEQAFVHLEAFVAADMIVDLKAAHLHRPLSSMSGYRVNTHICWRLCRVFAAYPCIDCTYILMARYDMPLSRSVFPIPPSWGCTTIRLGAASILSIAIKYKLEPPKYHAFVPCVW